MAKFPKSPIPKHLSWLQFSMDKDHPDLKEHTISAHSGDTFVGAMSWNKRSGRVKMLAVVPEARKMGVAKTMWDTAHRIADDPNRNVKAPTHDSSLTADGMKFAKRVGGKIPKNAKVIKSDWLK